MKVSLQTKLKGVIQLQFLSLIQAQFCIHHIGLKLGCSDIVQVRDRCGGLNILFVDVKLHKSGIYF